jgi:hypothetical protein
MQGNGKSADGGACELLTWGGEPAYNDGSIFTRQGAWPNTDLWQSGVPRTTSGLQRYPTGKMHSFVCLYGTIVLQTAKYPESSLLWHTMNSLDSIMALAAIAWALGRTARFSCSSHRLLFSSFSGLDHQTA